MSHQRIAIYGGNGFIGSHIAEQLAPLDTCVLCISRTGHKPAHLREQGWSDQVKWCQGDAADPDPKLLKSIDVVICCVGSPPLPTVSAKAKQAQIHQNGVTNATVIQAAGEAGVKKVILVSAQMPAWLAQAGFGYAIGKQMSEAAATEFAALSPEHRAVIVRPGVVYGTRHTASGTRIPLRPVFEPLNKIIPSQFASVQRLAERVSEAVFAPATDTEPVTIVETSSL